jgi:hypothetical protein
MVAPQFCEWCDGLAGGAAEGEDGAGHAEQRCLLAVRHRQSEGDGADQDRFEEAGGHDRFAAE